jgi:hypothetical protein
VVDKASFLKVEIELTKLQDADLLRSRPAIIVANKIDLARSRAVSAQGKIYKHRNLNNLLNKFYKKQSFVLTIFKKSKTCSSTRFSLNSY